MWGGSRPTLDQRLDVPVVGEVVGLDDRVVVRVGGPQGHVAPGVGALEGRVDGEALLEHHGAEVIPEQLRGIKKKERGVGTGLPSGRPRGGGGSPFFFFNVQIWHLQCKKLASLVQCSFEVSVSYLSSPPCEAVLPTGNTLWQFFFLNANLAIIIIIKKNVVQKVSVCVPIA